MPINIRVFQLLPFFLVGIVAFLIYFHSTTFQVATQAARLAGPNFAVDSSIEAAQRSFLGGIIAKSDSLMVRQLAADDRALQERHKLRWLYKYAEIEAYRFVEATAGTKAALYARMFHYALLLALGFFFIVLSVQVFWGRLDAATVFLLATAYCAFVLFVSYGGIEEDFTPQEMACVALGTYASLRRRLLLFVGAVMLASVNRETGVALSLIWPIINGLSAYALVPLFVGVLTLIGINLDLASQAQFWSPATYVTSEFERPGLLNFYEFPLIRILGALLAIVVVLSPLSLAFRSATTNPLGRRLLFCILLYLAILLFGTYLGNIFPYMILAPLIIVLWAKEYPRPTARTSDEAPTTFRNSRP